jgi:phosphatidylserine/phosphatidylglycerophosphate/cardiolipin synthase-like enzyme
MARALHPQTQVIVDQEYLPALLQLIAKAKTSIDILSYSFAIGSATGRLSLDQAPYAIAKKLAEVKETKRRVRMRLFAEGLRETSDRNRITGEFLERAGVEVRYGSTHAKGFCFDGRCVFFGSTNLTNQSIIKNHEANLLIDDRDVAKGFVQYFAHLWNRGEHGGIDLPEPWLADGAFEPALINLCERAKRTLDFSIYFFNHREIEGAIVRAHGRGVRVRGLVHQHKSFAYPYVVRNRATVERMRAAGVSDLHLSIPTTFSHSKYIVADEEELMLGTGNWLLEDVHIHPQLYIHLEDANVSKALLAHLATQIQEAETAGAETSR